MEALRQFVVFIGVFAVVIVFHELGHFLAAKAIGVRVEVFAFGFGRRLFGRKIGETDYRVSLIPLGGYVRMSGEGGEEPATGSPREFESRTSLEKLTILGMGPAFNAILAFLLLTFAFSLGMEVPAYLHEPAVVGRVEADSPAAEAGLVPGDLIRAVDGRTMTDWEKLLETIWTNPNATLRVAFERGGVPMEADVQVEARTKHAMGWIGVTPCSKVIVRGVTGGSPAAAAGVRPGDALLAIDGTPPCSVVAMVQQVHGSEGRPLAVRLDRGGEIVDVEVAAAWNDGAKRWMVGIAPGEATVTKQFGVGAAAAASLKENWRQTGVLVETVGKLLTGRLSLRTMSGPMELAEITTETAEAGLVPLLRLVALVSLNLAIFNLLPIPLLDGGRIFIVLVEAVRGRELERRTKEWILQAGLAMIVALMAVVLFLDVIKKLEG